MDRECPLDMSTAVSNHSQIFEIVNVIDRTRSQDGTGVQRNLDQSVISSVWMAWNKVARNENNENKNNNP